MFTESLRIIKWHSVELNLNYLYYQEHSTKECGRSRPPIIYEIKENHICIEIRSRKVRRRPLLKLELWRHLKMHPSGQASPWNTFGNGTTTKVKDVDSLSMMSSHVKSSILMKMLLYLLVLLKFLTLLKVQSPLEPREKYIIHFCIHN